MRNVVIVDSVRTGLAKSFRGFNQTRADNMTAHLVDAHLKESWIRSSSCRRHDFRLWRT